MTTRHIISSPTEDDSDDIQIDFEEPIYKKPAEIRKEGEILEWPNFPNKRVLDLSPEDMNPDDAIAVLIYAINGSVTNYDVHELLLALDVFYQNERRLKNLQGVSGTAVEKQKLVREVLKDRESMIEEIRKLLIKQI